MMKKICFNMNETKLSNKNDEYYGTLKIIFYPKNFIFQFIDKNNNLINSRKRNLNYEHKYTPIGKKIREKFQPNSEICFENLNFTRYDISQPDFIIDRIWVKIFDEHIW